MSEIPSEVITEAELIDALEAYATLAALENLADRMTALETDLASAATIAKDILGE